METVIGLNEKLKAMVASRQTADGVVELLGPGGQVLAKMTLGPGVTAAGAKTTKAAQPALGTAAPDSLAARLAMCRVRKAGTEIELVGPDNKVFGRVIAGK